LVLFGLNASGIQAAASHVYTNRGDISAIDVDYETIVVEVPVSGQMMTVGGPLVPDADLKRGDRSVSLDDFSVGESVTVKWRYTDNGHRILGVYGR
jgi:hypothetical protein